MRKLLVEGDKTFMIEVPEESKITFGPFSPPSRGSSRGYDNNYNPTGTLRIYAGATQSTPIIGVFSGVSSFRDISLEYAEQVAVEEGSTIWKSDVDGYMRESKVEGGRQWVKLGAPELTVGSDDADGSS